MRPCDVSDGIPLEFTESCAPVANSAIVIAGLATVSPEEHSLIIRDVPPDESDQFRVHWEEGKKGLLYLRSGG